jgi:hypothetical protein
MQDDSQDKDMRSTVRNAIQDFFNLEQRRTEPAYKAELLEERKRREQLEHRLNELVEENRRSRQQAEELERSSTVRAELQRLGVAKVDLAYRALREDIKRTDDGRLVARTEQGEQGLREYIAGFVADNPELLPARIPGGSGAGPTIGGAPAGSIDLDKIRPGMSAEESDRIRQEISRLASQAIYND